MFSPDQVEIDIADVDRDVVLIDVGTPLGKVEILGRVHVAGSVLFIEKAHVDGLEPGCLGRAGIIAILRKLLKVADVERLVIQGETRTTGLYVGKRPSVLRFPR